MGGSLGGGAVFQILPGQNTGEAIRSVLGMAGSGAPSWLSSFAGSSGSVVARHGVLAVATLALVDLLVGLLAWASRTRRAAVAAGAFVALAYWVLGQDLGQLYSGQATDPNSGPLLILMAALLLSHASTVRAGRPYAPDRLPSAA